MTNYVVASSKSWFKEHSKSSEYKNLSIYEISTKKDLNLSKLEDINPRYIFFPHWNWKIVPEIYLRYECVVFHTAPLPYGRGGSPIQNLIINGFKNSPICALKITDEIDAGPIYDSLEISLSGSIDQIFQKISVGIEKLIISICQKNPVPAEQTGNPFLFKRLSIADNELSSSFSINNIFDRIRMVDGKDYSNAYINFGDYKIEFKDAEILNNNLYANIKLFNPDQSNIKIRKATIKDSRDIFVWRNDSSSQLMFASTKVVEEDEHNEWFSNILNDPLVTIYIGTMSDNKAGVCRFNANLLSNSTEVSINLNPIMRGKNLSSDFLIQSVKLYRKTNNFLLTAMIKKNNDKSLKLFRNCGFIEIKNDDLYYYLKLLPN